jgi:hypothetical protein
MKLGEQWDKDPRLKTWFHRFDLAIGVLVVGAVAAFVWHKLRSARGGRTSASGSTAAGEDA